MAKSAKSSSSLRIWRAAAVLLWGSAVPLAWAYSGYNVSERAAQSAEASWNTHAIRAPAVKSRAWAVLDEAGGLMGGNMVDAPMPIASITKLMLAMVYLDARPDLSVVESIEESDVDVIKKSGSRLAVGARLRREDLLRLALVSSENRAASALARSYPGGTPGMVQAMNAKARALGLSSARFVEPTGLSPLNVASARDVAAMALAARKYPAALEAARVVSMRQEIAGAEGAESKTLGYKNTNKPLREGRMSALISKTGYINEAGKCLAWALSAGPRAVGLAVLGAPSFVARDSDGLRLSAWAQGREVPPEMVERVVSHKRAKASKASKASKLSKKIKLAERKAIRRG